jgi:NADH dehydrogenase
MVKQIRNRLRHHLWPWRYRDFGSLVSLGSTRSWEIPGWPWRARLWIEGWFARMMYLSLYKMHELALPGSGRSRSIRRRVITRRTEPHVKLH